MDIQPSNFNIDYYIKGRPEIAKESMTKKLKEILQNADPNTNRDFFILFEIQNPQNPNPTQSLLKLSLNNNQLNLFYDDYSYDRSLTANPTLKNAILDVVRDSNIGEVSIFDFSGSMKKAVQIGFFSGAPGARMNVNPIARSDVSSDEIQIAKEILKNKFSDFYFNERTLPNLVASYKELSQATPQLMLDRKISEEKITAAVAEVNQFRTPRM